MCLLLWAADRSQPPGGLPLASGSACTSCRAAAPGHTPASGPTTKRWQAPSCSLRQQHLWPPHCHLLARRRAAGMAGVGVRGWWSGRAPVGQQVRTHAGQGALAGSRASAAELLKAVGLGDGGRHAACTVQGCRVCTRQAGGILLLLTWVGGQQAEQLCGHAGSTGLLPPALPGLSTAQRSQDLPHGGIEACLQARLTASHLGRVAGSSQGVSCLVDSKLLWLLCVALARFLSCGPQPVEVQPIDFVARVPVVEDQSRACDAHGRRPGARA